MTIKDRLFKATTSMHRTVFRASRGRVFGRTLGMSVMELVTTGRRSEKKRSTMLTVPIVDGDTLVVVASFGGDDRHPAWYVNLRVNPRVHGTINGSTRELVARTATAEERAELWPCVVEAYPG